MSNTNSAETKRVEELHAQFASSPQLHVMFPSRDAFVRHMLLAEWSADDKLRAEFPTGESYAAYVEHSARGQARILGRR
jgi:hypothetical protein